MLWAALLHSALLSVVYFDQRLGAAHPKCWLKKSFSVILTSAWTKVIMNHKFSYAKSCFFGNKTLNQQFGTSLKNLFLCCKFVTFLHFFSFLEKKAENDYLDQRLGCAAPKGWSKYTTAQSQDKFVQKLIMILIIEQSWNCVANIIPPFKWSKSGLGIH